MQSETAKTLKIVLRGEQKLLNTGGLFPTKSQMSRRSNFIYFNNMRKISISILFLFALLNINAQNITNKRLIKIDIPSQKKTVSFNYNGKNEVSNIVIVGTSSNHQYTLSYYPDGSLKERKLNRDKGDIKIDFVYSYNNEKIAITVNRSGKIQKKSVVYDNITLDENKHLTETYSIYDKSLNNKFVYDENGNLITSIQYHGNGNAETTSYEYNNDISPLSYLNLPTWFLAYDFSGMNWSEGLWGKNTVKRQIMKITDSEGNNVEETGYFFEFDKEGKPIKQYRTSEVHYTYEYDSDGYPTKQYKNGNLAKEFIYEIIK
jgi:hypothetical protein